jgi:hypothetical protein
MILNAETSLNKLLVNTQITYNLIKSGEIIFMTIRIIDSRLQGDKLPSYFVLFFTLIFQ